MSLANVLGWAIFGLIAGALARLLHPGRDPMNWLWTMLLGIGGSVVGGWIVGAVGLDPNHGIVSWAAAIGGGVLLLALRKVWKKDKKLEKKKLTKEN